jgi:hypothetical protein
VNGTTAAVRETGRLFLDYFLYATCENGCDCIPFYNADVNNPALGVNRGNCQAHAYYDLCNAFPQIKLVRHEDSPNDNLTALPDLCPLVSKWIASPAARKWLTNGNTTVDPNVNYFMQRLTQAEELLTNMTVWQSCFKVENVQGRIHPIGSTASPTQMPSKKPTNLPTNAPTRLPSSAPTTLPTSSPTTSPTNAPTQLPTNAPTQLPTNAPTQLPTNAPTQLPTNAPSKVPTKPPTKPPTKRPTKPPTKPPTKHPTKPPTKHPTTPPTTAPTQSPTLASTNSTTAAPTTPSLSPSQAPTTTPPV